MGKFTDLEDQKVH